MKLLKNSLLCLILSGTLLSSAFAEKFDISQKIEIDASRQAADLKNKIFSYIDNVVITQGSLIIRADLVQVLTQSGSDEKTYIANDFSFSDTFFQPSFLKSEGLLSDFYIRGPPLVS